MAEELAGELPTLTMGGSLQSVPGATVTLATMPATQPDVLSALLRESGFDGRALPLSSSIKAASGRYRPEHGTHYRTPRRRLIELNSKSYDDYLTSVAPKDCLIVVVCGAGWLPQWRRMEPLLETLNGRIDERAIEMGDAAAAATTTSDAAGGGGGGGGMGGSMRRSGAAYGGAGGASEQLPRFLLRKFDMSNSRKLRDRYNINTLVRPRRTRAHARPLPACACAWGRRGGHRGRTRDAPRRAHEPPQAMA